MGKYPKDRRGTAQDERSALIFAHPTPSGPSGHLPLTGGVGPGPHYGGTPSWEVVYHFRRANSEWPSKFPPGHWALGLQKLGLVQFRSCAWRCPANIPGTNPGGPVWDRPLREQHSRSYFRRRGGSKTRPQNLPLGEGGWPLGQTDEGPGPDHAAASFSRRGGTLGRPGVPPLRESGNVPAYAIP